MDPLAAKFAFSAAAAGAALLGALYPVPRYEVPDPGRPWARTGAANGWQPASGIEDRYSYSGALPMDSGPVDVYGRHPWVLAREREILARQEATLRASLAEAVDVAPGDEVVAQPDPAPRPQPAVVTVVRGSKEAEEVPLDPAAPGAETPPPLALVSEQ